MSIRKQKSLLQSEPFRTPRFTYIPNNCDYQRNTAFGSEKAMKAYIVETTNKHFDSRMLTAKDIDINYDARAVLINSWAGAPLHSPYRIATFTKSYVIGKKKSKRLSHQQIK